MTSNRPVRGPAASPIGTPVESVRTARKEPASSLGTPSTTQPEPARKIAMR